MRVIKSKPYLPKIKEPCHRWTVWIFFIPKEICVSIGLNNRAASLKNIIAPFSQHLPSPTLHPQLHYRTFLLFNRNNNNNLIIIFIISFNNPFSTSIEIWKITKEKNLKVNKKVCFPERLFRHPIWLVLWPSLPLYNHSGDILASLCLNTKNALQLINAFSLWFKAVDNHLLALWCVVT